MNQEAHILRSCLPSVFASSVCHLMTIYGDKDRFVIKVMNLRDDLFLVGYTDNVIELMNLNTQTAIDRIELQDEKQMIDFDFHTDETAIIVAFNGENLMHVNFQKKTQIPFSGYMASPLVLVKYIKNFPGKHFLTLSRAGVYRVHDQGL